MEKKDLKEKYYEDKYRYFDVTADIGFYSFGKTIEEGFENSGLAMFNVVTNTEKVSTDITKKIAIKSEDLVSLLYLFLEELLFLHEVDFLLFSEFKVKSIRKSNEGYELISEVKGEEIDWSKHERRSEVKAITFHLMEVKKKKEGYELRVILDL
ncbi:MAG: archease [Methanobrevibacter sp.]|jgi:SHS2 domain-containing protein|nr:archease [Candidatus Methanovirga aequatorialis]